MEIRDTEMAIRAIMRRVNELGAYTAKDRTLKLYDTFFYCDESNEEMQNNYPMVMKDNEANGLFYQFCEDQYDMFKEDCEDNLNIDLDEVMHYIARTSHFNCCPIEDFEDYGQDGQSQRQLFEYLLETLYDSYTGNFELDDNLKIVEFGNDDGESQNTADYIRDEMMQDVEKYFADSVTIADYIDTFKAGQVDTFKAWMECRESDAEYEATEETKSAIASLNDTIKGIVEKSADTLKAEKLAELNEQMRSLKSYLEVLEA